MNRVLAIAAFCVFFTMTSSTAQEENTKDKELDSLQTGLEEKGVVIEEMDLKKVKSLNPLAPSKAAFYSAIFPGLGQIYNKRYWKVPIVYAALGTGIAIYIDNNKNYNRFRDAFKRRQAGFIDDEFYDFRNPDDGVTPTVPDFDVDVLENQQERFQRDRDLALLVTIILYALNIVDANVDAHLKQFNISNELSMNMEFTPYLDANPITTDPNYGMALLIKF